MRETCAWRGSSFTVIYAVGSALPHCRAEAIGGVPREILYERMKTAVIGEEGTVLLFTIAPFSTARGTTASSRGLPAISN